MTGSHDNAWDDFLDGATMIMLYNIAVIMHWMGNEQGSYKKLTTTMT
jgi:hypothetical protein